MEAYRAQAEAALQAGRAEEKATATFRSPLEKAGGAAPEPAGAP